jgi:hypothetical protein
MTIKTKKQPEPQLGDLVYCHCVGSKYGWYLDQLGIIATEKTSHHVNMSQTKRSIAPKPPMPELFAKVYDIYLTKLKITVCVDYHAFENGDLEIISKYTREQVVDLTARKADLSALIDKCDRR